MSSPGKENLPPDSDVMESEQPDSTWVGAMEDHSEADNTVLPAGQSSVTLPPPERPARVPRPVGYGRGYDHRDHVVSSAAGRGNFRDALNQAIPVGYGRGRVLRREGVTPHQIMVELEEASHSFLQGIHLNFVPYSTAPNGTSRASVLDSYFNSIPWPSSSECDLSVEMSQVSLGSDSGDETLIESNPNELPCVQYHAGASSRISYDANLDPQLYERHLCYLYCEEGEWRGQVSVQEDQGAAGGYDVYHPCPGDEPVVSSTTEQATNTPADSVTAPISRHLIPFSPDYQLFIDYRQGVRPLEYTVLVIWGKPENPVSQFAQETIAKIHEIIFSNIGYNDLFNLHTWGLIYSFNTYEELRQAHQLLYEQIQWQSEQCPRMLFQING